MLTVLGIVLLTVGAGLFLKGYVRVRTQREDVIARAWMIPGYVVFYGGLVVFLFSMAS